MTGFWKTLGFTLALFYGILSFELTVIFYVLGTTTLGDVVSLPISMVMVWAGFAVLLAEDTFHIGIIAAVVATSGFWLLYFKGRRPR